MATKANRLQPSRLTAALLAAFVMPVTGAAFAQDANAQQDQTQTQGQAPANKAANLDKVVVTGSLIPQTTLSTFKPVTVISAEDLKNRGYNTVQQALHESSFATGGVQGEQTSNTFTQGAETNSLFGLDPSYTKYLIDGRPMANYPALYNGSQIINNISGIPIDLVERIEILPGGQSSLYGSDAIAGVVNIILKKKVDGAVVGARFGWYSDGGGESQRYNIADGFGSDDGRFNIVLGAQFEHRDPIWTSDRDLTKTFNQNGNSPPVASRDVLVIGALGPSSQRYLFLDPANCANVSSGFGGTEGLQTRPGRANPFCGSLYTPGYATLKNGKESAQFYSHATFDINDNVQLYGDLLLSNESTRYHAGSPTTWWGTSVEFSNTPIAGYFWDPNQQNLIQLQRNFMPEDMGGWERSMSRNDDRSYALTLGVNGTFGQSTWDYDVGVTRTEYRLTENQWARLAGPINDWFNTHILGPQQGTYYGFPVYTPNYADFYKLIPVDAFNSFTDFTHSHSRTYDNMLRAQVTNSALFSLPGGDAGLAVAVEVGNQGWEYNPDPRLIADPVTLQSQIWGLTSVSGNGSRSRYAVTGEMRMPVWDPLTITASARYDRFDAGNTTYSKPTYALGIEYRPIESLLFRGKYGTAFKAPTLADEFQGLSGFYSSTNDYLYCYTQNPAYTPDNFQSCLNDANVNPVYAQPQYFGTQSGNPNLKPITADVWSYGAMWAPTNKLSLAADFYHWNIKNEVAQQSVDQMMRDDLYCTIGQLDPNSGTCQAVFNAITRDQAGHLQTIHVTKINVAREVENAVTFTGNYTQGIGSWGDLHFNGSWTRILKHEQQTYPTDPVIDLLNNGYYSRDPHYRANASVSWNKDAWTTTLYANYIGPSGNYIAWTNLDGFNAPGGGKVGSYTTYNASVNWDVTPSAQLSFIVTNLFNRYPDMDVGSYSGFTGTPYNNELFDAYGRGIYLEGRWNFGKGEK